MQAVVSFSFVYSYCLFMFTSFSSLLMAQEVTRVAIVGAGAAGLSAAYHLKTAYGIDADIYEASERAGGRIYTKKSDNNGYSVELGASFIDEDHRQLKLLVHELGLNLVSLVDKENAHHEHRLYYFDQRIIDTRALFPLFSATLKKIQHDIDTIAEQRSHITDESLSLREAELNQMTIAHYLSALEAPAMFNRLVDATQMTEYGARIGTLNALSLLSLITIDWQQQTFKMDGQLGDEGHKIDGGNSLLIERLQASLSRPIQFSHELKKITRNRQTQAYRLYFANNRVIDADFVIVALPNPILKEIEFEEILNPSITQVINFTSGNVYKFIMAFKDAQWRERLGLRDILSDEFDIWDSSFNERDNKNYHLTVYMGEPLALINHEQSPEILAEKVLAHLEPLLPDIRQSYIGHIPSHHWPSERFSKGAFSGVMLPKQWQLKSLIKDFYVDNLAFAGEQWSLEHAGFMEGAVETGLNAARIIGQKATQAHFVP